MEAVLLAQSGLAVPEIAAEMGISQRSARRHLTAARAAGVRTRPATAPDPTPAPAQRRDGKFTTPKPPPAKATVLQFTPDGYEVRYRDRQRGGALGRDLQPGDLELDAEGKPTGRYLIGTATVHAAPQSAMDYYSPSEQEARQRAIESGAVKAFHVVDGVLTEVEDLSG
jgi:hypothetical protein